MEELKQKDKDLFDFRMHAESSYSHVPNKLLTHDPRRAIGKITEVGKDEEGVYIRAKMKWVPDAAATLTILLIGIGIMIFLLFL